MPKYNGVIPTDLEKRDTVWTHEVVGPKQRVIAAKLAGLIAPYGPVAVAISMIEQPGKVANENAVGLMPWKREFPWGWRIANWNDVRPDHYWTCGEGQSDKIGVFFGFPRLADSLKFCANIARDREIVDGESYCRLWVGQKKPNKGTVKSFNEVLEKINRLWAYLDSTLVGPGV